MVGTTNHLHVDGHMMDETCMKCMNFKKESSTSGIIRCFWTQAFENHPIEKVSSTRGWKRIMHHKVELCTVAIYDIQCIYVYIYIHIYRYC